MEKNVQTKKTRPGLAKKGMKKKFLALIAFIFFLGSFQQSKGQAGAALNFNSGTNQVNCGNSMNTVLKTLNNITVEAWVNPTNTTFNGEIIGNYSSPAGQMQFLLRRDGTTYNFFVDCGSGFQHVQSAANTVTLSTWQHVAGVWNGSQLNLYINGQSVATTTGVTGPNLNASITNSVVLGYEPAGGGEVFTGSIDEVRVWTRALCQGEIQNNMNGELSLPQTGLLAYYQFNQGTASGNNSTVTTLTDMSGNGYNGTLNNFLLTGTTSNWVAPGGVVTGVNAPAFVPPSISISGPSVIGTGGSATLTASGSVSTYTWSANASSATTSTVALTPTATATYSVVGTNSLGCISNTAVQTLSVNPLGEALNFDGTNDEVQVGNAMNTVLAPLNNITVEAWIYPTSTAGSYKTIIGNYSNPANQMQFDVRLQQNSVVFFVNCGAGFQFAQTAANTITLNTWQHVACVWDGSKLYIYINGALLNAASGVTGSSFVATTNSVVIGGNTVPEMFNGSLDEIRVWTRALCQGEIQNNMNGELSLPQTGLLAYYQFNEGVTSATNTAVTTLTDVTGNGYNGTLMNFALTGTTSNWVAPGGVTTGSNAPAFVAPSISVSASSVAICPGATTTLTASGNASTYTWTAGPATAVYAVTPTVSATYSVVGTNSLGCISNMATTSITVNPTPTVTAVSSVTNYICVGQTATLTAGGAVSYVWNTTATTAVVPVNPTVTTTYSVTGTDSNGCTNMATITQSVSTCTGINSIAAQDDLFRIYPNPSSGVFNISVASAVKIEITNMFGEVLEARQLEEGNHQVNLSEYSSGVYFVRVIQGDSMRSMRLIKQ